MNPFRIIGVISKRRDPDIALLQSLQKGLEDLGCEVLFEKNKALDGRIEGQHVDRQELSRTCELLVVVGGDGTLLDVGRTLAGSHLPILGINQGRLGFMVDIAPAEMLDRLATIIGGEYEIEERLILQSLVNRGNGDTPTPRHAVNDVVVRNQATIRMIEFETWMDEEFISRHRADGLIIASPTGSTAYALSSGGPLLHPSLSAIAMVPICPHTLSDRPIIVSGEKSLRIFISGVDRVQAMVTLDGQTSETLEPGDEVVVKKADRSLRLIHPTGYSYFRILRNKLRWGSGPDNAANR